MNSLNCGGCRSFVLGLMLVLLLPLALRSEEIRPSVRIVWTENPPQIDGKLGDPAWEDAALIDTFLQVTPVPGGKPSQRTDVRLSLIHI